MKFLIEYEGGPANLVGPFDSKDEANAWASRYAEEYAAMKGPYTLSWSVSPIVEPATLEWW